MGETEVDEDQCRVEWIDRQRGLGWNHKEMVVAGYEPYGMTIRAIVLI